MTVRTPFGARTYGWSLVSPLAVALGLACSSGACVHPVDQRPGDTPLLLVRAPVREVIPPGSEVLICGSGRVADRPSPLTDADPVAPMMTRCLALVLALLCACGSTPWPRPPEVAPEWRYPLILVRPPATKRVERGTPVEVRLADDPTRTHAGLLGGADRHGGYLVLARPDSPDWRIEAGDLVEISLPGLSRSTSWGLVGLTGVVGLGAVAALVAPVFDSSGRSPSSTRFLAAGILFSPLGYLVGAVAGWLAGGHTTSPHRLGPRHWQMVAPQPEGSRRR